MKENKTAMNDAVRAEYEPVSVRVLKVTPQGVLCQSGGSVSSVMGVSINAYTQESTI